MAELSQFLNTGSVKTVSIQTGSFNINATGVKLTASVTSTQKAVLSLSEGASASANVDIDFGVRNVYSGSTFIFDIDSDPLQYRNRPMTGGKGESLTVTLTAVGTGNLSYYLQIVEID